MFKLQIYYKSILFYFIKNVNQIQNIQKYFRKDKISSGTQLHSLFYFTSTVFIHFLPIAYTLFLNSKIRFLLFQFAKTAKNYSPTFGSTQQYVRQKSLDELCNFLEAKVNIFDEKGADYMGTLAQNAVQTSKRQTENEVEHNFFSSAEFEDFQRSIENFRQAKAQVNIKLQDYLQSQAQYQ